MKLYILLDNLRSAYNIGSFFRTCDSAGVDKIILCGYCAIPPHEKLNKTALGSINSVSWEHHCQTNSAINHLKSLHFKIIAFETNSKSKNLFNYTFTDQNTCLVFGNEEVGINATTIDLSDDVIKIPQYGIKESLNVAAAGAIGIYECKRQIEFYSY